MLGDAVIHWTARLFVACYAARLCIDAAGRRDEAAQRVARWMWTAGCGVFVLHVAAAFHFLHGWSHAAAFEHVRQRTLNDTGWNSGLGIYFNYAFGLLWLVDTLHWWQCFKWSEKRRSYWITQYLFAFMMFQATAIFGEPFWKPVCVVVVLLFITLKLMAIDRFVDHR
jgi:hypothetical protein